jgi:hypothetical protein
MGQKGSQFERDMCRLFSRWVSGGDRDDLFWRTSQSGGRATACSRRGAALKSKGFYGDMSLADADHPTAKLFADNVSVEFKRGYNRASIQDIIDLPARAATRTMEYFLDQAARDAEASGRLWMLVWKRDSRDPIVVLPPSFGASLLGRTDGKFWDSRGQLTANGPVVTWKHGGQWCDAMSLETLFKTIIVNGVAYDTWRTKATAGTPADH